MADGFVAGGVAAEEVVVDGLDLVEEEVGHFFAEGFLDVHRRYALWRQIIHAQPLVCFGVCGCAGVFVVFFGWGAVFVEVVASGGWIASHERDVMARVERIAAVANNGLQ